MQSLNQNDPDSLIQTRQEIAAIKFRSDDNLKEDAEVLGLNISCAWPLPANLKSRYNQLYQDLLYLDGKYERFYIYPYEQTHITIATLVNFKQHRKPDKAEVKEIMTLAPDIDRDINLLLFGDAANRVKPFAIEFGPLILSRDAGYVLIKNPGGEIAQFRYKLKNLLEKKYLHRDSKFRKLVRKFSIPNITHSTIVRFKNNFVGGQEFAGRFISLRDINRLGKAKIDEFLLTYETQPYMGKGSKPYTYFLRE